MIPTGRSNDFKVRQFSILHYFVLSMLNLNGSTLSRFVSHTGNDSISTNNGVIFLNDTLTGTCRISKPLKDI